MKVYVLTIEQVWDYEQINLQTKVYYTEKDAKAAFKRWRDDEIKTVKENEWVIETDNDTNFEAFEDGFYARNHSYASVSSRLVRGKRKQLFFERYAALKKEEIDDLYVALVKAGGSYRFDGNAFIKVLAGLGGFSEDYQFCVVRCAELNDEDRITLEVESDYETYNIDASDVLGGFIHYITEEIEA